MIFFYPSSIKNLLSFKVECSKISYIFNVILPLSLLGKLCVITLIVFEPELHHYVQFLFKNTECKI